MSESKHTPGPWEVIDIGDGVSGLFIETPPMPFGDHATLRTRVATVWRHYDETIPNARLIAAAPDLLAACEAFAEWDCTAASLDIPNDLANQIRAAVEKAKA